MLNWDSEIVIWSRFLNYELWTCYMKSTLGSIAPLAMFIYLPKVTSPIMYVQIWIKISLHHLPAKDAHHKAHIRRWHHPFESTSPELFWLTKVGIMCHKHHWQKVVLETKVEIKSSIGVWVKRTRFEIYIFHVQLSTTVFFQAINHDFLSSEKR